MTGAGLLLVSGGEGVYFEKVLYWLRGLQGFWIPVKVFIEFHPFRGRCDVARFLRVVILLLKYNEGFKEIFPDFNT